MFAVPCIVIAALTTDAPPGADHPPLDHTRPFVTIGEQQRLLGDLGGARSELEDRGIEINADITIDWARHFRGGLRTGSGVHHLFAVDLELDMDRLLGLEGGTFFMEFNTNDGDLLSEDLVGDAQIFSNISEESRTQIAQLWYEQWFARNALRIKLGKVDANSEFAIAEYGLEFLNSSMGFSPTIVGFPTYPDPATSINIFLYPREDLYLGFGLYDGAGQRGVRTGSRGPSTLFQSPSDLFLIGEAGVSWQVGQAGLHGRFAAGGWHHTGTFERFDGSETSGTSGIYLVAEQQLWRPDDTDDAHDGIGTFFQYGYANPSVSEFEHHVGGGMTWAAPLPNRPDDLLGLGATWVRFTDATGAGFIDHTESAIELFYQLPVTPWLIIQPDVQYILNPGGMGNRDAVVGTLRFGVIF